MINIFWGFFAFLFGFLLTYVMAPIMLIIANSAVIVHPMIGLSMQIGVFCFIITFIFAIPLITAMSDDPNPLFKKMMTSATGIRR